MRKTLLSITWKATLPTLFFLLATISISAQKTWRGVGTATSNGGTDFNTAANWTPVGVPSASDDVIIAFVGDGIINLSGNALIRNLTFPMSANNGVGVLNVGGFTLTVNGVTNADILAGNNNTNLFLGVNDGTSPGTIDFVGNTSFGSTNQGKAFYLFGNSSSRLIFRNNLTLGTLASTYGAFVAGSEPGTVLFDGSGAQTYTANNNQYFCRFRNVIVGSTNNPTVTLAGSTIVDNILGDLTINGSSILDLNSRQLNRGSNGGTLLLKNTSQLKLAAAASTQAVVLGTATLIAGSNFPSGFTTVTLDSTSTVEFNGTAQTIPLPTPTTVYGNLTLSGSGVKTVGGNISINRALEIGTGVTMSLDANTATLKSNNQTTAFVKPVNGTITYGTGKFVIERFLKAAASWRLMATPITSGSSPTISASWREGQAIGTNTIVGLGTRITGPTGLDEVTQRASMKYYNMVNNTYVDVNAAALAGPIQKDQGYYVFVRGDRTVGVGGTTGTTNLRIAGQLRTGNQTFSVIKNLAPASGFQSVGNPYVSRIDVRNFLLLSGGVAESFYIWNPTGGFFGVGQFENYTKVGTDFRRNGSPGGAILNTIESGQGFFLQNNSTTTDGSITIKESDKITGSSLVSRVGVTSPTLEINLFSNDANNQNLLDGVALNFDANYSNSIDNYDVRKISNSNDNISIKQVSATLAVERRGILTAVDTLRINIGGMRVASYKLEIDPSVLGNLPLHAFLIDKYLVTETPVSLTSASNIAFSITSDAASRVSDRFMIVFRPGIINGPLPVNFTGIVAIKNSDKTNTVNWSVANEINMTGYAVERSGDGNTFTAAGLTAATANNSNSAAYNFLDNAPLKVINYYRIKATSANGQVQYSKVVKVIDNDVKATFTIQPNPVVNKILNLSCENMQGQYTMNLISKQGSLVFSKSITITSKNETKNIVIDGGIAAGMYELVMIASNGKKVVQTIFVQ